MSNLHLPYSYSYLIFFVRVSFVLSMLLCSHAWSQATPPAYAVENGIKSAKDKGVKPLSDNLLGDSIDPHSGSLSFSATDITLPGNSHLPVEVTRRRADGYGYELGYWRLQIPSLETKVYLDKPTSNPSQYFGPSSLGWHNNRCTGQYYPPDFMYRHQRSYYWAHVAKVHAQGADYSGGIVLNAPGAWGSKLMKPTSSMNWGGTAPRYTTQSNWKITCTSSLKRGTGEGFIGVAPNGDTYYFDTLVYRKFNEPHYPRAYNGDPVGPLLRPAGGPEYRAILYASKVEDVHGNWVKYEFSSEGNLTKIHANDGREITFSYPAEQEYRAHVNGRTWQYKYSSNPSLKHDYLVGAFRETFTVTLPDQTSWVYGQYAPRFAWTQTSNEYDSQEPECDEETITLEDGFTEDYYHSQEYLNRAAGPSRMINAATVKHPSGVIGYFEPRERVLRLRVSDVSYVDACKATKSLVPNRNTSLYFSTIEKEEDSIRIDFSWVYPISKKTLVGPGLEPRTTTYIYGYRPDALEDVVDVTKPAERTIVYPNGTRKKLFIHRFPPGGHAFYGKTQKSELYSASGELLEKVEYLYDKGPWMGIAFTSWFIANENVDKLYYSPRPYEVKTTRGTDVYTKRYTYNNDTSSSSYSFRRPIKVESWSNISGGYANRRIQDITYEHKRDKWVTGLAKKVVRNGKLFTEHGFDSYGKTLWQNVLGVRQATFTHHTSGLAKGQVKTSTDALNKTTQIHSYHRGQWTHVTRPDNAVLRRTIDDNGWTVSQTDAKGISTNYTHDSMGRIKLIDKPAPWADTSFSYSNLSNGLVVTTTHGDEQTIISYNGFLQPIKVERKATGNGGRTTYVNTQYDLMGRKAFVSHPSFSPSETKGVATRYDGLGRVVELQETVHPFAKTSTRYLNGNTTELTDALGFVSTTSKSGFGSPDDGQVTLIKNDISTTRIRYDIWGNPLEVTQFDTATSGNNISQTQKYYYNNVFRLCRKSIPEAGDTVYTYDNAGQMTYSSAGHAAGSSCALPSANRVFYQYDALGRVTHVDYPGTELDVVHQYDANGNMTRVANGVSSWDYSYNNLNMLTQESMTIDGRVINFGYAYNSRGGVTKITYPGNLEVTQEFDGFNRPIRINNYIDQVTYEANDSLDTLTFANGVTQSFGLNNRQLPSSVHIRSVSGVSLRHLSLEYDINLNLKSKIDHLQPVYTSHFQYDDLNRLTQASGIWGQGVIHYDALGNIKSKQMGNHSLTYNYDNRNRLVNVAGSQLYNFNYDPQGNVINNGKNVFNYNLSNQMISTDGGNIRYYYDAYGKRVKKIKNDKTEYFAYTKSGTLMYKQTEGVDTAYIYVNGKLVAKDRQ